MSEREAIRASRAAIEASVRIESPRVIGALVRIVRDVALAEDLAQEALVAALETWPSTGIPDRPGAWLVTTAKRRAIDELRRRERLERAHDALSAALPQATSMDPSLEEPVADDVLRLVLVSCHPVLSPEARVALTLRLVAGLTTSEIARAYLVPEATIAQRIVRAKKTLSAARVPFEVPAGSELSERLGAVREVLYLVFNEGYAASRGERWTRPELCEEALRLARILGAHVPDDAETHGLLALLELQASRLRARHDARGRPVLLADQDRTRWDRLLVERGLRALERAEALARPSGPYTLQAGIAACHARAPSVEETLPRAPRESHAASAFFPSPFEEAAIAHARRRRRVGHDVDRRRRGRALRLSRRSLPALARPALLGVHLLLRLQGQQRRVQAHGPRALRRAALRERSAST
jgi:RNA polymerase sigma-70 factor (ECF subfamily)